jgi:hypothetical protein
MPRPTIDSPALRRSTRLLLVAALGLTFALGEASLMLDSADARPRPTRRKSNFEANKTFGIGLMIGAPTGLSGKYFVGRSNAIDFGIGSIYQYRDRRGLHIHADYLWHPVSLASAPAFELPLYLGVGGRMFNGDRCYIRDRGNCDYYYNDYTAIGVRAPVGIAFDFNKVPLDIFLELAFVFDFVVDRDDRYDDDAIYVDLNGAFGVRYYFN